MKLTTINEWLPSRRKWGIYLLWTGAWSASTQWPKWAPEGIAMTRLYLTKPGGGYWWTPIVRVTKAPDWEVRL